MKLYFILKIIILLRFHQFRHMDKMKSENDKFAKLKEIQQIQLQFLKQFLVGLFYIKLDV